MSNTEQKIAEEAWAQKLDRARERIGTLREEKGDREFVAAHVSKGAIPRKEIEALRWLISQRFVVPETDNVQFALVLILLERLSQLPTPATASEQQPEADFIAANHHPSCTLNDQDLMWVCAQCGLKVAASRRPTPATASEDLLQLARETERKCRWADPERGVAILHEVFKQLAATPYGGGKVGSALDMLCQAEDCTELATGFQKLASQAVKLLRHVGKSRDEHNAAIIQSAIEKATAVKDEALVNYWRELQKVRDHWSGLLEKERAKTSGGAKSKNETKT